MKLRGFTLVELMMSLAVLAVGVAGISALQKVTAQASRHARSVAVATQIAQAWQDRLSADATLWNYPAPGRPGAADLTTETIWLRQAANGVANQQWFQPAWDNGQSFGPAFDLFGAPLDNGDANNLPNVVYCTHLRLIPLTQVASGNGVIRTEVRVFWRRSGGGAPVGANLCDSANDGANATIAATEAALNSYHFIYSTNAVKQHTAP